jgi:hypothetical protein
MPHLRVLDVVKALGIGTGDTGQFLALDKDGAWWLEDTHNQIEIKLANPNGLRTILNERHERGEL